MRKSRLMNWDEVIFMDPPPNCSVTKEIRQEIAESAQTYLGSSARMAMGKIWIDEEFEEYREKVLSTPLP